MLRTAPPTLALLVGSPAVALAGNPADWSPVPPAAVLETGDAWRVGSLRYRLYGVQACIRGTTYTGADGQRRDCGDASLAMLAGLIRALKPLCASVARRPDLVTAFVVCKADADATAGQRVDLGTALIAGGFAFAALDATGMPVDTAYRVAEEQAKRARTGLWSARDLPDPNALLLRSVPARGAMSR